MDKTQLAARLLKDAEMLLKQADDADTIVYEPASKKPPEVTKPKLIEKLTGQAKESITKILNRTVQMRELKAKQLETQALLTNLKNQLTEEQKSVAEELNGYMKMAEHAFDNLDLISNTAYALEQDSGMILAAIAEQLVAEPADPEQKIRRKDPQSVLQALVEMGKVTTEALAEANSYIDNINSAVPLIQKIVKTIYTFPPAQTDKFTAGVDKQGFGWSDFTDWFKRLWNKLVGFKDRTEVLVEDMERQYDVVQEFIS